MVSKKRNVDWFGLVAFAIVVAICLLVDLRTGLRAFGAWMMLTAVVQQVSGRLPIGFEGEPPSARTVMALNLLVGLLGLAVAVWPDAVIDIFF